MEEMRLNKYLAHCGICSRRDADTLIEQGKVMVNGKVATPGIRVSEIDTITVHGKRVESKTERVILAFYKPVGVTCSERDEHAERLIKDLVSYRTRVTYAGRLDRDSEGLMILTNDGDLIQAMMKGANGHEKEYIVKVNKEITAEFLQSMSKGVYLPELEVTTKPCRVEKIGKYTFRMVLTQGLNRQIRRMCKEFGYRVNALKRIRILCVRLGSLKPGEYVELSEEERNHLYKLCGLDK